jgi:hypothetical protein
MAIRDTPKNRIEVTRVRAEPSRDATEPRRGERQSARAPQRILPVAGATPQADFTNPGTAEVLFEIFDASKAHGEPLAQGVVGLAQFVDCGSNSRMV